MLIRPENNADYPAVKRLNELAFESTVEANLVDVLRKQASPYISLVAVEDDALLGHILFTPVFLTNHPELKIMGLAPMAVMPGYQSQGIGSALVNKGLEACQQQGFGAVVVLGHPTYYPRFNFVPSSNFNINCEFDVPEDVFMIKELIPEYLDGKSGTIKYHEAFSQL